jgi:oligoendopeptidase F
MMTIKAKAWDLSPLVPSTKLDQLKKQMDQAVEDAKALAAKYKGKIGKLKPKELKAFIEKSQELFLSREGAFQYSSLSYAANSLDNDAKQAADLARRTGSKIGQLLAFSEIELAQLVAGQPELIDHPALAEYKHALEIALRKAPHILSEVEEQLIIQKDQFGIDSWYQLRNDWLSTRMFEIKIEGEIKQMPFTQIHALFEDPDRDIRKAAKSIIWADLGKDEIIWASGVRALIGDHVEMSKKRHWPTPRTQSLIDNDVDAETIDALMTTVDNHTQLFQRYLKLKARLMNLSILGEWDVVAPLPHLPERNFDWKQARQIAIDTYQGFDQDLARIVEEMFDQHRIDGEIREGKRQGAFCASWLAGNSAFILMNFNGKLGEVFTLVHENGHAVHSYLMSSKLKPINTDIGMCIAEVASIFGELLLTDKLIAEAKTKDEKIEILMRVLDEFGQTVFQVSARYFFEMDMYAAFERGEYLDGETISKYWVKGRDRMFGDAVEWLPESKWEWTFKGHYYIPRFRLYNYPYVFANLFVFALYRLYKEQGKAFVPKLKRLLSAGSTSSPRNLATELGFDISKEAFWTLGMKQAEEFLTQLDDLIKG